MLTRIPTRRLSRLLWACSMIVLIAVTGCAKTGRPVAIAPETSGSAEPTTSAAPDLADVRIRLTEVASGFEQPLFAAGAADGSGTVYVVEKTGRIRTVRHGKVDAEPFLDLSKRVSTDSERGLLGLAFSPGFAQNGRFYVDYTDTGGNTVVSRFTARNGVVDPVSEETLLVIEQPYSNHNGGCVLIGPDRMLWIGMGDGGSGGDPHGNAQNPDSLLGKMLRIDVGEAGSPAAGEPYGIPADNPFANPTSEANAGQPEIWAVGLRNPWRFSFDSATGDLWIGDVGQNLWEEIDFVAAGPDKTLKGGLNFGWNTFEATHPYPPDAAMGPDTGAFTMPVIEYAHDAGESVTGGVVVRDPAYPRLDGIYLYADYVSGKVWGAVRDPADGTVETAELLDTGAQIVSFGTGDAGEVYAVDLRGTVYRVTE